MYIVALNAGVVHYSVIWAYGMQTEYVGICFTRDQVLISAPAMQALSCKMCRIRQSLISGFQKIHLPHTQQQVLHQTIAVQQFRQALVLKFPQAAFTMACS